MVDNRIRIDEFMKSWWRPLATFSTVAAALFFGVVGLAADPRAPRILQDVPIISVAAGSIAFGFLCAFVIAPWKRLRVSFGDQSVVRSEASPVSLHEAIVSEAERLFNERQYHAIVRHARWFSRYLWLEGFVSDRAKVGKIALAASLRMNDSGAEAAARIDDLGWSYVVMQKYREARHEIEEGLSKAEQDNEYYWIARGHRHLAGLGIEVGSYADAYTELTKAADAAKNMPISARQSVLVSIEYGRALCALRESNLDKCLHYIESAEKLHPNTSIVRGYFLRGMVLLRQGEFRDAETKFHQGIAASENGRKREEEIRNREGLILVLTTRGENERAGREQEILDRMKSETPTPFEHTDQILPGEIAH